MKYHILYRYDPNELVKDVQAMVDDGWEVVGPCQMAVDSYSTKFLQTLTKPKKYTPIPSMPG